ncbi:MAG: hypothetical protein WA130_13185 [Candidatus Methanoperedens sp.]
MEAAENATMITIHPCKPDAIAASMAVESLICIREGRRRENLFKNSEVRKIAQEIYRQNFPKLGSA